MKINELKKHFTVEEINTMIMCKGIHKNGYVYCIDNGELKRTKSNEVFNSWEIIYDFAEIKGE